MSSPKAWSVNNKEENQAKLRMLHLKYDVCFPGVISVGGSPATVKLELLFKCACLQVRESRDFNRVEVSIGLTDFENFKSQYEHLQSLEGDELFAALDALHINKWMTEDCEEYSKLDDGWYVAIRNN